MEAVVAEAVEAVEAVNAEETKSNIVSPTVEHTTVERNVVQC